MVFIEYVNLLYGYFKYPEAFLVIIPAIIILWLIIRKDWVKWSGEDATEGMQKRRSWIRFVVFFMRTAAFICLIIALASYFTEKETLIEGEPILKIVIDNSSSFALYNNQIGAEIAEKVGKNIRVETAYVGDGDSTALGGSILSSLTADGSVLVVSDGQSNVGADLGDVALHATRLNASISTLNLDPTHNDVRISIKGPSKTLAEIENKYIIKLDRVGPRSPVRVVVKIDGEVVLDKSTNEDTVEVFKSFMDGYHRVEAYIDHEDYFQQNNQFFKSVKVVPKPKIIYVTQDHSPMETLLSQVYEVTVVDSVPSDMSEHHAVVINNMNVREISDQEIDTLIDYTSEGNGMLVIGGMNAFERGGYKESRFEQLLPVFVAEAGKEEGDINVVLVIDISGSTGQAIAPGMSEAIHVNKAQAISVFNDLRPENSLGVVAFNAQGFVIEPMSLIIEKVGLVDTIAKIRAGGGTLISAGLMTAIDLLKPTEGSKNIIMISDGITQLASGAIETTELAERLGIKVYTVGVGARRNDHLLQKLAEIGHGIFFTADQSSKLKILFGDVEEGDRKQFGLTVLNENHFITEDLKIVTIITGYNPVVPKSTANLLVTTDFGDPVLTIWRYGLGRTATLTTDDGTRFSGELLNKQNSVMMTRTLNWIIGDPDRLSKSFVDVPDTRIGSVTKLTVKSPSTPTAEGVVFFKAGDEKYTATLLPEELGFQRVMDATFAVNYKEEFANLGFSARLDEAVRGTGGNYYEPEDLDNIIDDVTTRSKRSVVKKVFIRWPFIIAAMLLFLLEIFLRRLYKNKKVLK